MEDDDETRSAPEPSALTDVGLTSEEKPLETLEVENADQWGAVPASLAVSSEPLRSDAGATAEEDAPTAAPEMQTEAEERPVSERAGNVPDVVAWANASSDTVEVGTGELEKLVPALGVLSQGGPSDRSRVTCPIRFEGTGEKSASGATLEEVARTGTPEMQTEAKERPVSERAGNVPDFLTWANASSDTVEVDELENLVPAVGVLLQVGAGARSAVASPVRFEGSGEKSASVSGGAQGTVVAPTSGIGNGEAVADEEVGAVGNVMEMRPQVELIGTGVGDFVMGWNNSIEGSVVKGEDVIVGDEFKSKEGGVLGSVPSLGELQPVAEGEQLVAGAETGVENEAEGENFKVGPEMGMDSVAEKAGGDVARSSPILGESRLVAPRSPFADEVVVEAEVPMLGTTMEAENAVGVTLSSLPNKGVHQGDAVGEDRNDPKMEIEDEEMNDESQSENRENIGAELLSVAGNDDEDEAMVAEDENLMDTEMEIETDATETPEAGKGIGDRGKRKRGKNSRVPPKSLARKVIEEDVCFICFDGGDLVLCDRRGCPKAYHPSCVNRDEAFFRAKGRWNCGWHLCSICERNAYCMCYTCTFSLCKACSKDARFSCVRGNKGFCETCMKTVMLIEENEQGKKEDQLDFDDKSSWLYLFKDYWINLKQKLSLSSEELAQAEITLKESDALAGKQDSPEEAVDGSNHQNSGSDSEANLQASKHKKRKTKKRLKSCAQEEAASAFNGDFPPARKHSHGATAAFGTEITSKLESSEWASKELLEFVMHVKNGDKSVLSQFDVQALLLEYIKANKLRDPRRKSQIICDARLQSIFGKPRVGHFEMLKLLESHFLIKEDSQTDDNQGSVVDSESNVFDADGTIDAPLKGGKDRRLKTRRKGCKREPQSNLDDYAAIDRHNVALIFLRRKLVEDLLEDIDMFSDKVAGTFVRIRISGSNQKQDIYRLVQVLGTSKAEEPYKVGKRTTDLMLEILNLNKKELVSIDTISNQEFTEEECKRLRQSIKCGLINRLTVGDILDKAMELQAARVNDWLESETVRLSHLRDRASEKGRRKELRECVEKLQLLKTPEERRRRLDEVPEIHADPNMDPNHESEDNDSEMEDDNKQEFFSGPRGSGFGRKGREPISPRGGNFSSVESSSGTRQNSGKNWEVTRILSTKDFANNDHDSTSMDGIPTEGACGHIEMQQAFVEKVPSAVNSEAMGQTSLSYARLEPFSGNAASETSQPSLPTGVLDAAIKINESEKMWHYKDPAGKVQGPFSVVQLRKWSKNGYFPLDLRIWKTSETEDDSILLTDALAGNFEKGMVRMDTKPSRSQMEPNSSSGLGSLSIEVPKLLASKPSEPLNLPSPTPNTNTPVWSEEQVPENKHSSSSLTLKVANSVPEKQNGNQENAFSTSLLNTGRQLKTGFQNDSASSLASSAPAPNPEQGIHVGPTNAQPTSITNGTQGWGSGSFQNQVVPPYQIAGGDPQATVIVSSQNLELNPSFSMPVQQQNPWGAVPSTVQNASASFQMPGYVATPLPDAWRPPVSGNQPSFPPQGPPNGPWGMGMPENVNAGWGTFQGNPSMGWGGFVPGTTNMNWGPMVNPGWVTPTGNPVAMVQAMPPGNVNPGWVAQQVNQGAQVVQGLPPGNVNPGWGPPPGTPAANAPGPIPVNANQGWGTPPPSGNSTGSSNFQGPSPNQGNVNQRGWGTPPPRSSGGRGNENRRGRFSGSSERGPRGGRPYYRPASYDSDGNRICPYHLEGHCLKGSRCDMVHQKNSAN